MSVNGTPISTDDEGRFNWPVALESEGPNEIELLCNPVEGVKGESSSKHLTIVRDTKKPSLEPIHPASSQKAFETTERRFRFRARATDDHMDRVLVNDQVVEVDDKGAFERVITLGPGSNLIEVKLLDTAGNQAVNQFEVVLESRPWTITDWEPEDGVTVREPRVEVSLRTVRHLSRAKIDGADALDPKDPTHVRLMVHGLKYEMNEIPIWLEDLDGNTHKLVRKVRYWPFPDWMEIVDPSNMQIHAKTGLPYVIRRASDKVEMVLVESGSFQLGNPRGAPRERPAKRVFISKHYYIDRYELSNLRYANFLRQVAHDPPPHWKDGKMPEGRAGYPVVGITWDDANAYGRWAEVQLPTEAEWEYAAKGATHQQFPWGEKMDNICANFDVHGEGTRKRKDYAGFLMPVDAWAVPRCQSPFGAVQMAGNAWEWCADSYVENAYDKYKVQHRDPFTLAPRSVKRVIRGGSWYNLERDLRTTWRRGVRRDMYDPRVECITARFIRRVMPKDLPPK